MVRAESRHEGADVGLPSAMSFCDLAREATDTKFESRLRQIEERGARAFAFHRLVLPNSCANIMAPSIRGMCARFAKRRAMSADPRTIVHLIRHGDALPDDTTEFTGASGYDDLGLSTIGQRQARALGARLARNLKLAGIVSSPTLRALETARAVGDACGLDVTTDARMREIGLGNASFPAELGGRERATAIRERLSMLAEIALRDGSWAAVPDAERASDVRVRFASAIAEIVRANPDAHVAVVSHAGSINAYCAEIVGTSRDFFFPAGNTSLSSVRIAGNRRLILRLNDTAHLEDGGSAR